MSWTVQGGGKRRLVGTGASPSKPWGSFMKLMLIVAILLISAVPVYAEEQQANTEKLKAGAQNVFKIISGDKLKIQTIAKLPISVSNSTGLIGRKTPRRSKSWLKV